MIRFRTTWTIRLISIGAFVVSLASPATALAEEKVSLQVWAIRATTKNNEISPELKNIAGQLKSQFRYTGFKLEKREAGAVEIRKSFSANLPGGYKATVNVLERTGDRFKFEVEVRQGRDRKLNSTFTVSRGKFQLMGGWDLGGGDALIVAVSAR